MKGEKNSVV